MEDVEKHFSSFLVELLLDEELGLVELLVDLGVGLALRTEQAGRGTPLMTMAQAPQTSSMQLCSHATGSTRLPSVVTGSSRRVIRAESTLSFGRQGTRKVCQ